MPTYKEPVFRDDLHLGHKVPTVGTDDLNNRCVTEEKMADGSVSLRTLAQDVIDYIKDLINLAINALRKEHDKDIKTLRDEHYRDVSLLNKRITDLDCSLRKEMAELRQLVTSYTANGIALSSQFGSHDDIGMTQRTLTNAINAIWKTIRDMKGEVNDGITVTITPDWFISEDTAQVNISAKANDGVFEKLQIYINDDPVFEEPVENVQMIEHVATMSETSRVKTVAQILGMEYTDEQIVTKYYPFFMGSGQDWEDIVNEQYVRNLNNGKLRGGYNINIEHDGDYMFIIIPTSRQSEIVRFDMNGYEIPMEVINNQVYTIYKSANAYRKGLFQIDITTNCECEDCQ